MDTTNALLWQNFTLLATVHLMPPLRQGMQHAGAAVELTFGEISWRPPVWVRRVRCQAMRGQRNVMALLA